MGKATEQNIRVFVRVRPSPSSDGAAQKCVSVSSDTSVILDAKPEPKVFNFDTVVGETSTQEEVFSNVGRNVIENCLQGYNGTIFAYGQTGSGKTFTMMGPTDENDDVIAPMRGIIPRSFEHLFALIDREKQKKGDKLCFICNCSFLEIYNERVFDLLDAASTGLQLREDVKHGVIVQDITEVPVETPQEAMEVLKAGGRNRRVAETSMNRESSRSHAVFTMSITSKEVGASEIMKIKTSRLNLIDLAGSERQKDTKTEGVRLKEAGSINKSLSALGNVIHALVDVANGKSRHVAYRDSKLTFLLRDSLGGNTKTYLIANVNPLAKSFGETLSTLNFARRAKLIKNKATVNADMHGNVQALHEEIRRLKDQLASGVSSTDPAILALAASSAATGTADGNDTASMRQLLLDAFHSRDIAEREKNFLLEKVAKLQELVDKKEKCLQSSKMILKFRDTTIKRLEGKKKGVEVEVDSEIVTLQNEIKELRHQLEHHPEITRYVLERNEQAEEFKKLKNCYPSHARDNQELVKSRRYTLELEGKLQEVMSELGAEGTSSEAEPSTPVAHRTRNKNPNPSTPTMGSPRQRNQEAMQLTNFKIQQRLEEQISALNDELAQFKEQAQKAKKEAAHQELELRAETEAAKKTVVELEAALAAQQMKASMQMQQLLDNHSEQIEQFSSPRKQAPGKAVQGDEDVESMWQPIQTFKAEMKTLRAKNESLVQEAADAEVTIRSLKQEMAKAQIQLEGFKSNASEQDQVLQKQETEFKQRIEALSNALQAAEDAKAERDASFTALEQQLEEARLKQEQASAELAKRESAATEATSAAEAEAIELRTTVLKLKEQMEAETTKLCWLQDEYETLEAEMSFKDSQIQDRDATLQNTAAELLTAQEQYQALEERLASEQDTMSKLKAQLEQQSESAEFIEAINKNETMQAEIRDLSGQIKDLLSEKAAKETDMAALQTKYDEMARAETLQKEAMAALRSEVQTLRGEVESAKSLVSSKDGAYQECHDQYMESLETIDRLKQELKDIKLESKALTDQLAEESEMHESDLLNVMDELKSKQVLLTEQENASKKLRSQLQATEDSLTEAVKVHEDTKKRLDAAEEEKVALEAKVAATPAATEAKDVSSYEMEITTLKKKQAKLLTIIDESSKSKNADAEEIESLRGQVTVLKPLGDKLESMSDMLETTTKQLEHERAAREEAELELKASQKDIDEKLSGLNTRISALQVDVNRKAAELARNQVERESVAEDMEMLLLDVEKQQNLAKKLYEEKDELKSTNEQLQEELMRMKKDLEEVTKERDQLVGHQNKQQRIQHFMQIKQENSHLARELAQAKSDLAKVLLQKEKKSSSKRSSLQNREGGLTDVTNSA